MFLRRSSIKQQFGIMNVPKPTLTNEEVKDLRELFNAYDSDNSGRINPSDLLKGLKEQGFDLKCGLLYEIVAFLNTKENRQAGISFQDFLAAVNENFGFTTNRKEIRRIWELFVTDAESDILVVNDLKKVSDSMGFSYNRHDLVLLLKEISALRNEMTFEEFYLMISDKLIISN
jgi:Ca2+-binding EF-hand superfamily protein